MRDHYDAESLEAIRSHLERSGTFAIEAFDNGLYSAATGPRREETGYVAVWIRDNVHVAHAEARCGRPRSAARNAESTALFLLGQRPRFEAVIDGRIDPRRLTERPHIRFDGRQLRELDVTWPHAQNDALGYFLWLYAGLARDGHLRADPELLLLVVRYLGALPFWTDAENGHWEETPKIEASSVGTVIAGLEAVRDWAVGIGHQSELLELITAQLEGPLRAGRRALDAILPAESVVPAPGRRYDAALLFLVEPLRVVDDMMARRIASDVTEHLLGEHGIRRYLGDSYWAPDYESRYIGGEHGDGWNGESAGRDDRLQVGPGEEAQWCLFDPVLTSIYSGLFRRGGDGADLERATWHFNRALRQLTPEDSSVHPSHAPLRCCELYYRRRGRWVPNPNVPLLWTQANLKLAFRSLGEALSVSSA